MTDKTTILNKIPFYLASIIAICLNISTIKSISLSAIIPSFEIIIIFYCIAVKSIFGFWWVSFLTIWQDAILEIPIGLSGISYLISIKIIIHLIQHPLKELNKQNLLNSFIIFIIILFAIKLLLIKLFTNDKINIAELFVQLALTIIVYPLCDKFLDFSTKKILKERY